MSCLQLTICRPTTSVINIPRNIPPPRSSPHVTCISSWVHRTSQRLTSNVSTNQRCAPVCLFGGKRNSEDDKASPWKSLENAMGGLKKDNSIEDILRKQIEKQEYFDDGGSGGSPPLGGGDGSGGSEDEGFAGIMDEFIQVILASIGFIFLYIYIIDGEEMTRLAKDYIKYLFGGKTSVRLRRAMYEWGRFYRKLTKKKVVQKGYLEQAILNTPTWWDNPAKYRRVRSYIASESDY